MNDKLKHLLSAIIVCFFIFLAVSSDEDKKEKKNTKGTAEGTEQTEEQQEAEPIKEVEWADGNTYTYDYTETLTQEDSAGNVKEITVYMSNKPHASEIVCDTKVCKWCGKEVEANDYSIEEYPNINLYRGKLDYSSMFEMIGATMFDGNSYLDLDNNRIRTEWRVNCKYRGPKGFCSMKCENEYKYR